MAWDDRLLRQRVKDAGGRWVHTERLWVLPLAAAKRLGLGDRLVPVPARLDPEVYHEEPHGKPICINRER